MNKIIDFHGFVEFGEGDPSEWTSDPEYGGIPKHTREALHDYFVHRHQPGSFLMGVLTNNLYQAAQSADVVNAQRIKAIVSWLTSSAPVGSYGSEKAVASWLKGGYCYQQFIKNATWRMLLADADRA